MISYLYYISLLVLLVIAILQYHNYKDLRRFMLNLVLVTLALGVGLFLLRSRALTPKGQTMSSSYVAYLYASMLLGMVANYCYRHFSNSAPKRAKRFEFGPFIAPVFISPIVFLPLITAFQDAELDFTKFPVAPITLLIVAFQNGFFWKDFFDNRRKDKTGEA
jgi:CDP-diglyceride synthetase